MTNNQPGEEIRLACYACDREDFDGVASIPLGWAHVTELENTEPTGWWTHLGWCPDCKVKDVWWYCKCGQVNLEPYAPCWYCGRGREKCEVEEVGKVNKKKTKKG